jgi:PTH1 family peptidyl-tRNA hydrolase
VIEKKYNFSDIKAIIGLGNPGQKYVYTRHNIGFRVLERFAEQYGAKWSESGQMANATIAYSDENGPRSIELVRPLTYMNNSGEVIPFLLKKGIKGEQLLVIHDDLEKDFGKIAIRWDGSARGHNGLRSIESMIGKDFWRLRCGIGRPESKNQVSDYVLSRFTPEEEGEIEIFIEKAIDLMVNLK